MIGELHNNFEMFETVCVQAVRNLYLETLIICSDPQSVWIGRVYVDSLWLGCLCVCYGKAITHQVIRKQ